MEFSSSSSTSSNETSFPSSPPLLPLLLSKERPLTYSGGDDGYLTDSEVQATMTAAFVISMLSLCGSCFIIVCYIAFKHLRKFAFTLVMILSCTDVLNQAFDFIQPSAADLDLMEKTQEVTTTCYIQAIGNSIFELASVLWTTAIAATLYMFIFLRMPPQDVERKLPLMFVVCFGLPILLALLPLLTPGAYGPSGAWCWIRSGYNVEYWQFVQFYGPLWTAIVFNSFVYARTWKFLQRTLEASGGQAATDETYQRLKAIMQRLQGYPFILFTVWFFASVNRIYEASTNGKQVFALYFLQRTFSSSQGFLNALAYGFSGGVRESLLEALSKCCPRLIPHPSLQAAGLESMGGLGVVVAGSGGNAINSSNNNSNNNSTSGGGGGGAGRTYDDSRASLGIGAAGSLNRAGNNGATSYNNNHNHNTSSSTSHLQIDDDDIDDSDIHVLVPPPTSKVTTTTNSSGSGANIVRNPVHSISSAAAASSSNNETSRLDRVRTMGK